LAEVPEASAVGSLADVYADIRRVLGVANVVLVDRAFAAQPGRLERVWSVLRPNLASAQARIFSTGLSVPAIGSVVPYPSSFSSKWLSIRGLCSAPCVASSARIG
jgi:hypothetical protein